MQKSQQPEGWDLSSIVRSDLPFDPRLWSIQASVSCNTTSSIANWANVQKYLQRNINYYPIFSEFSAKIDKNKWKWFVDSFSRHL